MKRLIAIPCFNEEENISKCLDSLIKTNILDDKTSILVVNDGSVDRTLKILESYKDDVKIISSKTNFGLSEVFNSIMNYGKSKNYDQLVIFDSDNQYPPEDIPQLFELLTINNVDLIIGARNFSNIKHFSKIKIRLQKFGSFVISKLLSLNLSDVTTGFRGYSNAAMNNLFVLNNFTYTLESLFQLSNKNLKINSVLITQSFKTRESRLFRSNSEYVKKSIYVVFKSLILYKSRLMSAFFAISFSIPGFFLLSRFFLEYFKYGNNSGNIQSLVVGVGYFNLIFLFYILFFMIISNYKNRMLVTELLYKPKHI
tara:strand:- start:19605 stop:20540 length:936 start_codon:yes stop_codon:yes gene_type:complete